MVSVSGGMTPVRGEASVLAGAVPCSSTLTGSTVMDSAEYLLVRGMLKEEGAPLEAPSGALFRLRTTTLVQGVLLLGVEQEGR